VLAARTGSGQRRLNIVSIGNVRPGNRLYSNGDQTVGVPPITKSIYLATEFPMNLTLPDGKKVFTSHFRAAGTLTKYPFNAYTHKRVPRWVVMPEDDEHGPRTVSQPPLDLVYAPNEKDAIKKFAKMFSLTMTDSVKKYVE
jgi:hypothetical protein